MAERSHRHPTQQEKDQSGCMWSLIGMLDFRQARPAWKLIADKRRGSKHITGIPKAALDMLTTNLDDTNPLADDNEESKVSAAGAGITSVKKLMEADMYSEEDVRMQKGDTENKPEGYDLEIRGHVRKNHKEKNRTHKKDEDSQGHDLKTPNNLETETSCDGHSEQPPTECNLDVLMEELCSHQKGASCVKHDQHDVVHNNSNCAFEEKLREAVKALMSQKFNEKQLMGDGEIDESKQLGAMQTLNSNREALLKLLQDPNSLLAKYIQKLHDTEIEKDKNMALLVSNLSEQKFVDPSQSKELVRKHHNFFRRRTKSSERNNPPKGNEKSQALSRIVVLKPGVTAMQNSQSEISLNSLKQVHSMMRNTGEGDRGSSQFSLAEVRRKLWHAMGKERDEVSRGCGKPKSSSEQKNLKEREKGVDEQNTRSRFPKRYRFYMERFAVMRRNKSEKAKNGEISLANEMPSSPNRKVSNIYAEARKQLSEMLNGGDENEDASNGQNLKTLGRILSLPEYNVSPLCSPGRDNEQGFLAARIRLSPNENWMVNENIWRFKRENSVGYRSPLRQKSEAQSGISHEKPEATSQLSSSDCGTSDEGVNNINADETLTPGKDGMISEAVNGQTVRTSEATVQEDSNFLHDEHEPHILNSIETAQADNTSNVYEEGFGMCLKLVQSTSKFLVPRADSTEETPLSPSSLPSPSNSQVIKKIEDLEMLERPSPISVLDPVFLEDNVSPTRTIFRPDVQFKHAVEPPIEPRKIQFDEPESSVMDQAICVCVCGDDKKSAFEYVKAVVQASGLSCDELCMISLSSDDLLDPALYDDIEFFPHQITHDQKLLFDCINEVLLEVHELYFGSYPWVSYVKPVIQPITKDEEVLRKVWEGIKWHFLPWRPPRTLEQIISKDMAKNGTWMDLRFEVEVTCIEIGEAILNDLVEDSMLSFINEDLDQNVMSNNS
ncbi:protein of unknown function DUF4378 [Dillenia turbinata]|uniref:DUF4378 domain-containing protein n=1 Tax=Dillenia turbinata TaxID=194707 RepID=A0AAN8UVG4_9MAGN